MRQIVKVVVRMRGRSAFAKLDQARFVVSKMKDNANFADLADQVTELETAADTLDNAITMARSGDHELVGLKQIAEDVLMVAMAKLCDSINGEAAGDKSKLLTCGLPLRRENNPIGELNPPTKVEGLLTKTRGRASLAWKGPEGTKVYNVYMSTTNSPYNWTLVSATTKQRFNVDGLVAGTFYYFAVSAVGTAGESSKSEPAEVMAAA